MNRYATSFLLGLALTMTACGGGGSGAPGIDNTGNNQNTGNTGDTGGTGDTGDTGDTGGFDDVSFASVNCNLVASGPIEGPLDPVQTQLANGAMMLSAVPELGTSAARLSMSLVRFTDVVDALAASGTTLFVDRDPGAAGDDLDGTATAIQCGAISLAKAYSDSPLAEALPVSSAALVQDLAELTFVFDGPDSIGLAGMQELITRLGGIADRLAFMATTLENAPELLPAEFTSALPADNFFGLLRAPGDLLSGIAAMLTAAGALDGQQTADAIAGTVSGLTSNVAALDPTGMLGERLDTAQLQLANGIGLVLVPLFDAIANGLSAQPANLFGDFLAGGFDGFPGGTNQLEMLLGGNIGGLDTLESLLPGTPVLGDLLGLLAASDGTDFDFSSPDAGLALIRDLVSGAGPENMPDLLSALQMAGAQLGTLAPGSFDLGVPGTAPTDGLALQSLLATLPADSATMLLDRLANALGGNSGFAVPEFAPEDLQAGLTALFAEIADAGAGGGLLGGLLDALGGIVGNLLAALTGNPLAELFAGVFGNFATQQPTLDPADLSAALESVLGGLNQFAPAP